MVHSFSLLRAILFMVLSAQQMSTITDSRNIPKQRILSKHRDDWCLLFSQWSYHSCDLSSLQWHICPWGFLSFFAELCALYLKVCKELWGRIFLCRAVLPSAPQASAEQGFSSESKCHKCPNAWVSSLLLILPKLRFSCQAGESSALWESTAPCHPATALLVKGESGWFHRQMQ